MIEYFHQLSIVETLDIVIALGLISILLILLVLVRQAFIVDKLEEVDSHIIATSSDSAGEEKEVVHCWQTDHPDRPLECICKSGKKELGEPCVLNRH